MTELETKPAPATVHNRSNHTRDAILEATACA